MTRHLYKVCIFRPSISMQQNNIVTPFGLKQFRDDGVVCARASAPSRVLDGILARVGGGQQLKFTSAWRAGVARPLILRRERVA